MVNFHQAVDLTTKKLVVDCHVAPHPLHSNILVSNNALFDIF
jgi:hypothetical protein